MEYVNKLKQLIDKSVGKLPGKVGLAFSGGLDSSVLAKLINDNIKNVSLYVAGTKNSHDIRAARKSSKEIGLELNEIIIDKSEVKKALVVQTKILQQVYGSSNYENKDSLPHFKPNPVSVSYNLPLFFVAKHSGEKQLIVCHGPDDLYGGSKDYLEMDKKEALRKMEKELNLLFKIEVLQNKATARYFDKEFIMPYLDQEIINFSLSLPYHLRISKDIRKYILRKLAREIGFSNETAFRERKSAQYGSGIMKLMKKVAKDNGCHIGEYIEKIKNK